MAVKYFHFFLVVSASLLLFVTVNCARISCVNENGKAVDWYAAYKMPKIKGASWYSLQSGAALVYQDSDLPGSWKRLNKLINDSKSAVGLTLAPMYGSEKASLLYILYNDQPPPDRNNTNNGHLKGLILFNNDSGIWLVHTIPGFAQRPSYEGYYAFPSNGHLYGQSLLCISLTATQLDKVANQLYFNDVYIYDQNVPKSMLSSRPNLSTLVNPKSPAPPYPYKSTADLITYGGATFKSYAKSSKFKKDLYADYVAPDLQADLYVESWQNGGTNINSNCSTPYAIVNIKQIHFDVPTDLDKDILFNSTVDHSKWAVSVENKKPYVCIGDVNRQYGQYSRGGGTVCHRNAGLWKSYLELASLLEPCPVKYWK